LQAVTLIERVSCFSSVTFVAPSGYKMGDTFDVVGMKLSFPAKQNGSVMHLPVVHPVKITHTPGAVQRARVDQYIKKRNRAEERRKMILEKRHEATNKAIAKEMTALHMRAQLEERVANVEAAGEFRAERNVREPRFSSRCTPSAPPLPYAVGLLPSNGKVDVAHETAMHCSTVHTKRVVLATRMSSGQQ